MRRRCPPVQRIILLLLAIALLSGCAAGSAPAVSSAPLTAESPAPSVFETPDRTEAPAPAEVPETPEGQAAPEEDGVYTAPEELVAYIRLYGHLPSNFITKAQARAGGWEGGSLEPYFPGMCIGGDRFGNREGLLPEAEGRVWTECDVNTLGAASRGAERLVFSNDGLIYYTDDHYESFRLMTGG